MVDFSLLGVRFNCRIDELIGKNNVSESTQLNNISFYFIRYKIDVIVLSRSLKQMMENL